MLLSSTACGSVAEPTAEELDTAVQHLLAAADDAARRDILVACLARYPVDTVLTHLKAASERHFTINAQQSLCLADALIVAAELTHQPRHRALGLLARGDALRTLGHYQAAHDIFEEAGAAFLALGDEVGWARTRTSWVITSYFLGRGAEALKVATNARAKLMAHREWIRAAGLDQNTALVCYFLGQYDQAIALYERAYQLLVSLDEPEEERIAWVMANKAMVLTLLGNFREALTLHEEAQRVFVRLGATLSVLRQDQFIADVYASQGQYTHALRLYMDALAAFEQGGYETDATWIALNMIDCYLRLNRMSDALDLGEETVNRAERCGTPTEIAKARFACALALGRVGEHQRALALLESAAETFAATNHASDVGNVLLLRASLNLRDEGWHAALVEAERAGIIFGERNLVMRQAQADLVRARAMLGLRDEAAASELAASTLTAIRQRGISWLEYECHHILSGAALLRGDNQKALAECDASLSAIEQVQSRLASDWRGDFLADKLQVYYDAIACCMRLSPAELPLSFAYLERAKSRSLVDYLATNPEVRVRARHPEDQAITDAVRRLRAEHDWFYERLYGYGFSRRQDSADQASGEQESILLQGQIRTRERQITRLLERLDLRQIGGIAGLVTSPVTCAEMQARLDENTVLLEYSLHDQGGAVFILTAHTLSIVPLDIDPAKLWRRLNQWQLGLGASARALIYNHPLANLGANARIHLQAFYRLLIAPISQQIAGYERLIVVPFGLLHQVPFHALHDGDRYLIERHEVVVCPSSSLLALCTDQPRRGGGSALIVANSDQGRLPGVMDEARVVAALLPVECYLEEAATRAAVITAAPRHAILHLAAHGAARLDNPIFAHLKLADGQLSPADIFDLELQGAMVVLSGCETGRAALRGGDELIGLSRAFLHAGASTVIQSLWRVEDRSTADLMRQFYTSIAAGSPKGAALRAAQLALLREHNEVPYLWAPFQLIGDYDRA